MPSFPTSRREFIAAANDYNRIRAGVPIENPHPWAIRMHDERVTSADLAFRCCENAAAEGDVRANAALASPSRAVNFGLTTPDFKSLAGSLARATVERAWQIHTPLIKRLCRTVQLPNFRPAEVGAAAGVDADFSPLRELEPIRAVKVNFLSGESVKVESYAARVNVSRQLFVNDDLGAITDAIAQVVAALARREGAAILEPLVKVSNLAGGTLLLSDGLPMFSPDYGNLIVGSGSLTQGTFGAAITTLANQKIPASTTPGELRPRFALVNPADEMTVRRILTDCGMNDLIEVLSTVALQPNQFAVFADPLFGAVFASVSLEGSAIPVLGEAVAPRIGSDDVLSVIVRGDFGAAPIGRFGAVLCLS